MSIVKIQRQTSWTGAKETDPLILSEQPGTKNSWRCSRQTVRNSITFIALWIAYLVINAAYSILDPFYPQEAAVYGVNSLTVGFIMGVSPLCVVILSPILGYYVPEIGLKFMLISGSFLVGGAFILLGFLIKMSNYWEFVIFSMLLRIIEGIGSAGYITASFTIATILYPENTGTVIGLMEVGSGLGYVIGPPLGGFLYNFGGFLLPFVVTGGAILIILPLFFILIPHTDGEKQFLPPKTIIKLLIDVPFLLLVMCNIVVVGALEFFSPTMSTFLKQQFHLSELLIGVVFLVAPLTYMLSSFLAGKITDIMGPRFLIIGGIILTGCSYFFVGPAQFIVDKSYLWMTCISFGTIGIGIGFGTIPIFTDMLQIAQRIDTKTSSETMNAIISGLSSSTDSLGYFVCPIMGGGLTQLLGFQMASVLFGQLLLAVGALLLGVTLIDYYLPYQSPSIKTTISIN